MVKGDEGERRERVKEKGQRGNGVQQCTNSIN